ncbi:MAG: hypothetical protein D4R57_01420 [Verrucomicrobiales bacterium]|nr:MAG: hypothetical protein D4R57_01420 [Verrucomicrobiales bacterium]
MPGAGRLPMLGWAAFWLVQLQGLLGGLRVVLDAQVVADVRLGTAFGIIHGCLGQGFLVLLAVIALMTSQWWIELQRYGAPGMTRPTNLRRWFLFATILVFIQLLIAATMRHQHAGLAISDFPRAHGQWWPDMSAEAVAGYNLRRVEVTTSEPITAFQIGLQMTHRIVACFILVAVAACAWCSRRREEAESPCRRKISPPHVVGYKSALQRVAFIWLGLIFIQVCLGAWTIWSNKAADVATAHVVVGALSLVTGALGCLICFRRQTVNAPIPADVFSEMPPPNRASV